MSTYLRRILWKIKQWIQHAVHPGTAGILERSKIYSHNSLSMRPCVVHENKFADIYTFQGFASCIQSRNVYVNIPSVSRSVCCLVEERWPPGHLAHYQQDAAITPDYWKGATLFPWAPLLEWISNYSHYNKWNEITCPFPNFNGCTVEV